MLPESVQEELLSLSYIYPDSYRELTESSFQVQLQSQDYSMKIEVCLPPQYPAKERPTLAIKELSSNLSRSYLALWTAELDRWMSQNWTPSQLILYDMICQLQEKLETLHRREGTPRSKGSVEGAASSQDSSSGHKTSIVYDGQHDAGTLAAESLKTPVTLESFLAWRAAFEQEAREREAVASEGLAKENTVKLTGRQLFETDRALMLKGEESVEGSFEGEEEDAEQDQSERETMDAVEIDSSLFSSLEEIDGESL